jgi:hypothetical protein
MWEWFLLNKFRGVIIYAVTTLIHYIQIDQQEPT